MPVEYKVSGSVAIVTIDNPPVNALNISVRRALWELMDGIEADTSITAVILSSSGKLFIGGADINEFDRPLEFPFLPDIAARIERSPRPWIAAIHGAALGGGFELCLACAYRIATPDARFALPEVDLGVIPGAGGTQRLPRALGPELAIEVIAGNRVLDATAALDTGLVDAVVASHVVDQAIDFVRNLDGTSRPIALADRPVPIYNSEALAQAEERLALGPRGTTARRSAVEVMRYGMEKGIDAGFHFERQSFLKLRESTEARALRHLFFAERGALRPADLRSERARRFNNMAVVGGGTMGTGIAAALLRAGLQVVLVERDSRGLDQAIRTIETIGDTLFKKGSLSAAEHSSWLTGLTGAVDLDAASNCDFVIEAVFEALDVKREVFAGLVELCRTDCILATNTSYIDPREIFAGLPGQPRLIGMHFFSPAHVMRLVEIIPTPHTSPAVTATAFELARKLAKIPVRSGICEGFIGNRILQRYRSEAELLLRNGVGIDKIDGAMRRFGYTMGPFEMQDMAGLDISFLQREAARSKGRPVDNSPGDLLVKAGRKGQKTGAGWYDYAEGSRRPVMSAQAAAIISPFVGKATSMAAEDIAYTLIDAMIAEGKAILDEGIAASSSDIDLVEVHGYGFPRKWGGPMFLDGLASRPWVLE